MAKTLEIILPVICLLAASAFARITDSGQNGLEMNGNELEAGTGLAPSSFKWASASASESASASAPAKAPESEHPLMSSLLSPLAALLGPRKPPPEVAHAIATEKALQNYNSNQTQIQWPAQLFKPVKLAEVYRDSTDVIVPSDKPTPVPSNVINTYTLADFNVQGNLITTARFSEIYPGTFATGKDSMYMYVKRAMYGYENILYLETQVLNAIRGLHEAFPQVIYYDGKNLIQTPLCTTWYQYIYSEFYAGGLSLESGYNFMLEMIDALAALHTAGFVHRDINPNNIAFGCNWKVSEFHIPFKLSSTSKLYLHDFGAAENIKEAVLNKYYNFVGNWDFASIGTMNNEPATYAQDIESLAYCLLYSLNGGWLTWGSYPNAPTVNHVENIEKKTALDLDDNLKRLKGDEATKEKAKRDITKFFELLREHIKTKPNELPDYEALKACFNINEL